MEELKQKLKDVQKAFKNGSISINEFIYLLDEYCSMYFSTSQQNENGKI